MFRTERPVIEPPLDSSWTDEQYDWWFDHYVYYGDYYGYYNKTYAMGNQPGDFIDVVRVKLSAESYMVNISLNNLLLLRIWQGKV